MNAPQAIFFDMDGTLLNWSSGMQDDWLAACEIGSRDGGPDARELFAVVDEKRVWFWSDPDRAYEGRMDLGGASRRIVQEALLTFGLDDLPRATAIAADYRARRDAGMRLYDGAIDLLETVRGRGIRTALITNGEAANQRRSVERFGLAPHFDCVIIEGEFGCGKPDERVFRHALTSCGVEPERAWMVGDYIEADIAPAVALGMHAVWIDETGAGVPDDAPARPHRIIRSVSELLPLL